MLADIFGYDKYSEITSEHAIRGTYCDLATKIDGIPESLYLLCKEGWIKSVLGEFHTQKQALNRFFLGALLMSDPILQVLRRELRRISPDVRVDTNEILSVLTSEVIKRDVTEGDQAKDAAKTIAKVAKKVLRTKKSKESTESGLSENGTTGNDRDIADDAGDPKMA